MYPRPKNSFEPPSSASRYNLLEGLDENIKTAQTTTRPPRYTIHQDQPMNTPQPSRYTILKDDPTATSTPFTSSSTSHFHSNYHYPAPVGHYQLQAPLPPPQPQPSCGCGEYMAIGHHDPQNHGIDPGFPQMNEIVEAQAAQARVEGCVCQALGLAPGKHSKWVHQKAKKRGGKGNTVEADVKSEDEGLAGEGKRKKVRS